ELDAQDRAGKGFEYLLRQVLERSVGGTAEIDQQTEVGGVARAGRQEPAKPGIQVLDVQAIQRAPAQVVDGANAGDHLVPARLGQQRDVGAGAQVLVTAAQIGRAHV